MPTATAPPPANAVAAPRRRGRPRDERVSGAILQAALDQLSAIGYARLTMEGVACQAGVSRATLYRRFRDKADLVTAAVASKVTLPDTPSVDPRAELVTYLEEFDARFAEPCLEVLGQLIGTREDPRAMALHRARVIAPRNAYARSLLEQARDRGDLCPDADIDLALQMLAGSVFYRRVSGATSLPDWAERAVAMVFRALGDETPGRHL